MIVELKKLNCKIVTVDERLKSTAMKDLDTTMLPVLIDDNKEYEDGEEIESHLEKHFKEPNLKCEDQTVMKLAEKESPVRDFNKWIGLKDHAHSKQGASSLAAYFKKVEEVLAANRSRGDFLDGNKLKYPDCILLPKLYHMQVVAQHLMSGADLFKNYPNIKRYLDAAMKTKEFQDTRKDIDLTKFSRKNDCDIKDLC